MLDAAKKFTCQNCEKREECDAHPMRTQTCKEFVLKTKKENMSDKYSFIDSFTDIQKEVHKNAISKGWWEEDRSDGELIVLMHSELSEAVEGLRKGSPVSEKIPEFSNVEEELADCIIRIMDYAEARGMDVANALIAKAEYNKGRSYKHGGKKF